MSWWNDLIALLRSLFIPEPPPEPQPEPGSPQPLQRRVLQIVFDPVVPETGGLLLHQVLGWNDPDDLARRFAADLRDISGGLADYQLVDRVAVDGWPVKVDGFCYDVASFLHCRHTGSGWHEPDGVDYQRLVADYRLIERVAAGEIDEVWMLGTPAAGFYESIMGGPNAFWCNAPVLARTDAAGRRFVIMGFNYERGVGEMLESFCHRVESHLEHAWRNHGVDPQRNLWRRFIRYEKIAPGQANCGNVHFAPNSVQDYDWGNRRYVTSHCDDWLNFPALSGLTRRVNCAEWGDGDIRAHHLWWLGHLPRAGGTTYGVSNNWWKFAVDPNTVH